MFNTSIVSANRIAQFVARFEMQADGSLIYYHPDRATGGLPCSQAEFTQLLEDFAQTHNRSMRWFMYWVITCGIALGLLEASAILPTQQWMKYLLILAPLPFLLYIWYQAGLKPLQLLGDRLPCSPPRSAESAFWQRVNALPAGLFIAMLLPIVGLTYYSIEGGWENINLSYLMIIASNVLMIGVWLYARYRRKSSCQAP